MPMLAALLLAAQATQAPAAAPAKPAPPPAPCTEGEFRAFDFWVGEWVVHQAKDDKPVANSRIEKVSSGCAIRESWMPFGGRNGTSLSAYDPATGTWQQLWVGSAPGRVVFEGGPASVGEVTGMVLTGYWGKDKDGNPSLVRMTYTLREDGSVRQHGEASSDHGLSWADSFDLIYRPRAD